MKKSLLLIAAFITIVCQHINAQTWVPLGYPRFSDSEPNFLSMAIGSATHTADFTANAVYVAFADATHSSKASVMTYNGSAWVYLGTPGFSADIASFTQIATAPDGTPYVVYADNGHGGAATVMRYDGTNWVNVGSPGFSVGQVNWTCIAIDTNGIPYVFYTDFSVSSVGGVSAGGVVKKFNGSAWVDVGSPGFSSGEPLYTSIATAIDGTPYVSFGDGGYSTFERVMKFNGSSWVDVGTPAFSAGSVGWTSIAIDQTGTPYVAYSDASLMMKPVVKKFDGTNWAGVGAPGFTDSSYIQYTTLAIDDQGAPCVAYEECYCNGSKANVKRFDGSNWVSLGNADFSDGATGYTCIAIKNGVTYVGYDEGKATVMRLDTSIKAGVSSTEKTKTTLSVFPSPSHGEFSCKISSPQNEPATIIINNLFGQMVEKLSVTTNSDIGIQLNCAPGVYFILVSTRNEYVSSKIVIE